MIHDGKKRWIKKSYNKKINQQIGNYGLLNDQICTLF
jgi:hypothetical protein